MRDLEPSVQTFVFRLCQQLALSANQGKPSAFFLFVLSSYYLNGYGTSIDVRRGLGAMGDGASSNIFAKAYIYRFVQSYNAQINPLGPAIRGLTYTAIRGSRAALQDLAIVDPVEHLSVKKELMRSMCGVGADFFQDWNMSHGLRHHLLRQPVNFSEIIENAYDLYEFRVNRRGDRLIHFAAVCGLYDQVDCLIHMHRVSPDLVNDRGETVLLGACRSGHGDIVELLLNCGADASIAALNGETPLHWLVSFDDEVLESIGAQLVRHGGNPNCSTIERVCHSMFSGTIDFDFQSAGTPLNWAVHHNRPAAVKFLLKHGADPKKLDAPIFFPPLKWAAVMHHHECLQLMIEKIEETGARIDFNTLLSYAAHAGDKFSMIIRHGSKYKNQMFATFDLLRDKLKEKEVTDFDVWCNGFKQSLLFDAATDSHDDAVEYMLTHRVGFRDINATEGEDAKTALLACVRRNRKEVVKMLIQNGANVQSFERNPFNKLDNSWTVLHEFAYAAHNDDVSLCEDLVTMWGVPVDGRLHGGTMVETPFALAILHNAFNLADALFALGADINALSIRSTFLVVVWPTTILGHLIISNARHATTQVCYLLDKGNVNFVVEPERGLTALHRAAWSHREVSVFTGEVLRLEDVNMVNSSDIVYGLLQHFNTARSET